MDRMQELVNRLNYLGYQYYVLDEPLVSDGEYDKLYDELLSLEKTEGKVLPDSPTKKIGGEPIKEFKQHTHINKLYSLDKCKSFQELRDWDSKIKKVFPQAIYTLEYKLDGLTLCLTYSNGFLISAATRGNGSVGEDVTIGVSTIKSIPTKIAHTGLVEAQGEGIMRWSAFNAFNLTANEPLKNPRNGVAGAIRNLDPKVTQSRNLDIIFYNVNYLDDEQIYSQTQQIDFLKKNHFKTEKLWVSGDIEQLIKIIDTVDRSKLDFLIDGMVIKVDDFSLREKLGFTDKFPRWAIAYKFEAEEATTVLKDVVWQVGRTGKLTPLAILEPVELCGALVSKATLNNFSDILRKKVKVGSTVFVRRSNDVIPEILGIAEDNGGAEIQMPKFCPACNAEIIQDGVHSFCPNSLNCAPQICGRLEHFVCKECMDIDGVSEKTVFQLYSKLNVRVVTDIYDITPQDLEKIDGFKAQKIKNFIESVQKSKSADLSHFINALGIENIGKKTARDLATKFMSIQALMQATTQDLLDIPEIGDIMAKSIVDFFKENKQLINRFIAIGINPKFASVGDDGVFFGKKIVLTGSISIPRGKAVKMIEEKGGEAQSSVTNDTDMVIAGENAGAKLEKAKKLGKKIIDEKEFIALLNS